MRRTAILLVLPACVALAGCGGGKVAASGQLVKGGQPYKPAADEYLTVNLSSDTESFSGKVKEDGSFAIETKDGNGVPKKSYRVTVIRYRTPAASTKGIPEPPVSYDLADPWDVGASNTLTLDLGKISNFGKDPHKK